MARRAPTEKLAAAVHAGNPGFEEQSGLFAVLAGLELEGLGPARTFLDERPEEALHVREQAVRPFDQPDVARTKPGYLCFP